jgi:hypothetical protein
MDEGHINRVNWSDWKAWDDLYQKWVELYGKEKVMLDRESLMDVYEWITHEAGNRGLNVLPIDLLLDPSMTCEDAKRVLKSALEKPLSFEEVRELFLKRIMQYKEIVEELKKETTEPKGEGKEPNWVILRVEDSHQRDVGRGIARIDQRTMQRLGISAGDAIEIFRKRLTSATAWPAYSEDQNREIITIDDFTCKNAGVAIGDLVGVGPAKVKEALKVTLAPVDMRLNADEDFTNFVKNRLMGRTLIEGDITLVMMLGHAIAFTVKKTSPSGIVKVTPKTDLTILPSYMIEPTGTTQIELTSINDLDFLTVDVEVLRKEYDIKSKSIKLDIGLKVKYKNSEQWWKFASFMNESAKFSDVLRNYKQIALNELESIKNDLRSSCEQIDLFPITINLSTIGKTIAERIVLTG